MIKIRVPIQVKNHVFDVLWEEGAADGVHVTAPRTLMSGALSDPSTWLKIRYGIQGQNPKTHSLSFSNPISFNTRNCDKSKAPVPQSIYRVSKNGGRQEKGRTRRRQWRQKEKGNSAALNHTSHWS